MPIPTERIAVPRRTLASRYRRTSSIVHGNGERASSHLAVPREQVHERALGPMVQVARACCRAPPSRRRGPCSALATAARAGPTPAATARPPAPSRPRWPRARARARAPRSPRPASNSPSAKDSARGLLGAVLQVRRRRVAHSARSLGSSRSMPTIRAVAQPLGPLVGEHALAAAHVEHRRAARPAPTGRRASGGSASIRRRTTGLVEPYLSKVLPVGTASACEVTPRPHRAHSPRPCPWPAPRPRRSWPGCPRSLPGS